MGRGNSMKPIIPKKVNVVLTAEGCNELPAIKTSKSISTYWKPSLKEIAQMQDGGVIELTVMGNLFSPVSLEVKKVEVL